MEYCQKYNSKYNPWGKGVVSVNCNVGGNCLLIGKIREGGEGITMQEAIVNCLLKSVVFYRVQICCINIVKPS